MCFTPEPHRQQLAVSRAEDVTKSDISKAVHDIHGGMSHRDARKIVDLILDISEQTKPGW